MACSGASGNCRSSKTSDDSSISSSSSSGSRSASGGSADGCFLFDWGSLNFVRRFAVYTLIKQLIRNRWGIFLRGSVIENLFIAVEQIVEIAARDGWDHERSRATGAIDALASLMIVGVDLLQTFGTIKLNHTSRYQRNKWSGFQMAALR